MRWRWGTEQEKNSPDGLEGPARRFVMFGGGLSERQLEWFEGQLRSACRDAQRCVVFCHQPVSSQTLQHLDTEQHAEAPRLVHDLSCCMLTREELHTVVAGSSHALLQQVMMDNARVRLLSRAANGVRYSCASRRRCTAGRIILSRSDPRPSLPQVHPDTCTGTTLIWNYDEVMRIVQGAGNVVATLSGHAHAVRRHWGHMLCLQIVAAIFNAQLL